MEFNSLKQLRNHIEKTIQNSLENEVFETVKNVQQYHANTDVYDVYSPKEYIRRYEEDGLKDKDNMVYDKQRTQKGFLVVKNIADFNPYRPPSKFGYNLTALIEFGWEETYKQIYKTEDVPAYVKPRRFISNTIEELKITKSHVKALKEGLKRNGITTE